MSRRRIFKSPPVSEVGPGPAVPGRRAAARRSLSFSTLPVADQVRELRAALSVNKPELARILRVSRPTVRDWLEDGEPGGDDRARIRTLLRLLSESGVSANNPLFPRFVSPALESGGRPLLDLLAEETVDEAAALNLLRRAKALGDAIDAEREEREARLREAGFEEPDEEQRRINIATNVALLDWPRESDPRLRARAAKSRAD